MTHTHTHTHTHAQDTKEYSVCIYIYIYNLSYIFCCCRCRCRCSGGRARSEEEKKKAKKTESRIRNNNELPIAGWQKLYNVAIGFGNESIDRSVRASEGNGGLGLVTREVAACVCAKKTIGFLGVIPGGGVSNTRYCFLWGCCVASVPKARRNRTKNPSKTTNFWLLPP